MMKQLLLVLTCFMISAFPAQAKSPKVLFLYDKSLSMEAREAVTDAAKLLSARVSEKNERISDENFPQQLETSRFSEEIIVGIHHNRNTVLEVKNVNELFELHTFIKEKKKVYVVSAYSNTGVIYGIYRLVESFGVRFFHPEKTFVPEKFLFPVINQGFKPSYSMRGYQQHTLHPIEMMYAMYYPSAQNEKYVKNYILWLARNGQNFLTFPLLEEIEPRWSEWAEYMKKISAYAKARGVKMGPAIQFVPGLQKNSFFFLMADKNWKEKIEQKLKLYFTVPWDFITIDLGEFLDTDPSETVEWFNFIAHELEKYTEQFKITIPMYVKIHLGGNMKVKYQNEEVLYYFLPKFANRDVGMMIHTVMFYDLFRPAPAYGHENFYEHRELLKEQIGKREVIYFPESAYWCSFDIDVPVWFSEYIYARWNDMVKLSDYPLDGHVTFTSGFEWMHFLTDYLVAKQTWGNKTPLEMLVTWYSEIFGSASEEAQEILLELMKTQNEFLMDKNLTAFLSGEDHYDELGWFGNIKTHPPFVRFHRIAKMKIGKASGEKFEKDLQSAREFVKKYEEFLKTLESVKKEIPAPALSWHNEFYDSVEITKLRAEHVLKLYDGAFELRSGNKEEAMSALEDAKNVRLHAENVIRRREKAYRYPPRMMVERNKNYTMYPFAYLHQAHTLCFWTRREEELSQVISGKFNALALPKCL